MCRETGRPQEMMQVLVLHQEFLVASCICSHILAAPKKSALTSMRFQALPPTLPCSQHPAKNTRIDWGTRMRRTLYYQASG